MFLRQSTIQTIRFGPFLDATDGVTEEVSLTITQALRRLSKDGAAFAQTGTTGNATHDSDGWYSADLSAADTGTVGELILNVQVPATHLPVWARYWVVEEAVYDAHYGAAAAGPLQSTTAGRTLDVTAAGEAGLDLDNTSGTLAAAQIASAALTAAKFGADFITAASIADNSITSDQLGANAIGATQIATDAITAAKIAANAIGASELAADAIGDSQIATGAIASTAFAAGAIDNAAIAADAITAAKVAADVHAETADAVLDEDMTAHQTLGTLGQAIGDPVANTETIYKAVVTDAAGANVAADVVAVKAETASIQAETTPILADTADMQPKLGSPATDVSADIAAVKSDTAAILTDTGTTIPGLLPSALVSGRMDSSVGAMAANVLTAAAINADAITSAKIADNAIGSDQLATNAIGSPQIATGAIGAAELANDCIGAAQLASSAVDEIIGQVTGTATGGSTTTLQDTTNRTEADTDYWKGSVLLMTSGNINGQARRITAFDTGTDTLTVDTAFTNAVVGQTYTILKTTYNEAPAAGSGDWSTAEKEQIRSAMGLDGTKTAATGGQLQTIDTVVDGIQTDLSNGTDGLGAIKTETASIQAETTAILVDTATTIPATLTTIDTVVDGIQTDLDNGTDGLGAIKADTAAVLVDTGTTIPATLGSPASDVSADIAAVKVDTAAIVIDTVDLQARTPASLVGGRTDASVGAMAANVLTATAINADAITAAKIAANAIGASELATDAIGSDQMASTAINELRDAILPVKNAAFPDISVLMVDSTDHFTPKTGLSLTVTRSIDGGGYGAGTGTAAEIADGTYQYDASAADMNGTVILFRFTGTAADDTFIRIRTGG